MARYKRVRMPLKLRRQNKGENRDLWYLPVPTFVREEIQNPDEARYIPTLEPNGDILYERVGLVGSHVQVTDGRRLIGHDDILKPSPMNQYLVTGYFRDEGEDVPTEAETIAADTLQQAMEYWKFRPAANGGTRRYDFIEATLVPVPRADGSVVAVNAAYGAADYLPGEYSGEVVEADD